MKIYKRYELSKSLRGTKISLIARNSKGVIVFRKPSENKLKKAIDRYYIAKERKAKLAARLAARKKAARKRKKRKGFLAKKSPPKKTKIAKAKPKPKPTPTNVTKTQDGKFISKSRLSKATPPRKKHFWG